MVDQGAPGRRAKVDLASLADRLAITDVLTLYARGIDRCDLEALHSVFWPDATAQYGDAVQNAHTWAAATVQALRCMLRTQHALSNMLIALDGDRAQAETYCTAYHELPSPEGPREMVVGGRYLDALERRAGAWRITERTYVMDWNRNGPSTAIWDSGLYAQLTLRGARKPDDLSYRRS